MTTPLRLLVGRHPDDAEIKAGGLAALYRGLGHDVCFVSDDQRRAAITRFPALPGASPPGGGRRVGRRRWFCTTSGATSDAAAWKRAWRSANRSSG